MKLLAITLLTIFVVGCMETDARVMQLQVENEDLRQEITLMIDSIDSLINNKNLQIINLNAIIQARAESFDSLMVIEQGLWERVATDTLFYETIKARLLIILNEG